MNELSLKDLCCIFCCPPFPSKIAAKLAFLPPPPTYSFLQQSSSRCRLSLTEDAEWLYSEREKDKLEGVVAKTSKGNKIACLYVKCCNNARFTILYSHGNAVDLGLMSNFYYGLGSSIRCNIFSYDYSGYGISTGRPSEKNLYADIDCAWNTLCRKYNAKPEDIIVYGQSIGTVPSVHLAGKYKVGALILHSPLSSGLRVAFPSTKRTWFFDVFPNIEKIRKVSSPVLVIHGKEDEVIDCSHGRAIYERCREPVDPLWVEGAGHNDIELHHEYLDRLRRFISIELVQQTTI